MIYLRTRPVSSRFSAALKSCPHPHHQTSPLRSLPTTNLHRALHQIHIPRACEPGHDTDTHNGCPTSTPNNGKYNGKIAMAWLPAIGFVLGAFAVHCAQAAKITKLTEQVTALETYTGSNKKSVKMLTYSQRMTEARPIQEKWAQEDKLRSQAKAFEALVASREYNLTQTHIALLSKDQFLDALDRSVEGSAKPIELRNKEIQERRESDMKQQLSQVKTVEEKNTEIEEKLESDMKRVKTIVEKNKEIQERLEPDLKKPLSEGKSVIAVVAPKR